MDGRIDRRGLVPTAVAALARLGLDVGAGDGHLLVVGVEGWAGFLSGIGNGHLFSLGLVFGDNDAVGRLDFSQQMNDNLART